MVSVCRLCARWAESVVAIDDVLVDNLQHAKDVIKQMFHLELSCPNPYPNQVCLECVQYLKYSYVFYQQLLNAEKVFQTLQDRGELMQQLSEMKNAGDALQFADMVEEEPEFCVLPQSDLNEPDEMVGKVKNSEEKHSTPAKPSERVIEIKIEAMEELEIISCPLETAERGKEQLCQDTDADEDGDENHLPDEKTRRTQYSGKRTKDVNELCREPMTETVPPEQTAERKVARNKCYVCYKTYGTEAELTSHLIEHNDLLPYRCRQCSTSDCSFEFRTNRALNKHLETHWYPFECADCRLRFRKKDTINEHLRKVHMSESWYTCKRCGLKFQDLLKFRLHVNAHRNMESGRHQTAAYNNQPQHQNRFYPATKKFYQCSYCSRLFNHRTQYELHKIYHRSKGPLFRCTEQYCRKDFHNFREWRRHVKTHFPNDSVYEERAYMLPEKLQDPSAYPKACSKCHYIAPALKPMLAHYCVHIL
uniref:Uncharacterized protein n=1 Tax=Anopheles culicifacies TaxID=139723 RepID=A0A182MQZ6_9DIPT